MLYRDIKVITNSRYIPDFLIESRLFGVIFTRRSDDEFIKWIGEGENVNIINHLRVHQLQADSIRFKWFGFFILYIWYIIKNLINSNLDWDFSIRMNPFEIEAYSNEKFYLKESSWRSINTDYEKLIELYNLKRNHG